MMQWLLSLQSVLWTLLQKVHFTYWDMEGSSGELGARMMKWLLSLPPDFPCIQEGEDPLPMKRRVKT